MEKTIRPDLSSPVAPSMHGATGHEVPLALPAQYAIALFMVGVATFLAFVASSVVPAPGLTLIFVLPVVVSSTTFGLGPSLTAIIASVLAFDFFFTQPYMTLRMSDPSEIWAAGLLFITAAIVGAVAWTSRQNALEARRAAGQAQELRQLAHAVIQGASEDEISQIAAKALNRIFDAPAVILSRAGDDLGVAAMAGDANLTGAEIEAAKGAVIGGVHMRAGTYPHDQSRFDMWPIARGHDGPYVIGVNFSRHGVDRPHDADRLVEIVAGYMVASLRR